MNARHWWAGIAVVVVVVFAWKAFPRYEYLHVSGAAYVRVDHWTGIAQYGKVESWGWSELSTPSRQHSSDVLSDVDAILKEEAATDRRRFVAVSWVVSVTAVGALFWYWFWLRKRSPGRS